MNRRDFLKGMAGILAAASAPAIVHAANIMPVRPLKSGILVPAIDIGVSDYSVARLVMYDINGKILGMSDPIEHWATQGGTAPVRESGVLDHAEWVAEDGSLLYRWRDPTCSLRVTGQPGDTITMSGLEISDV